MELTRTLKKGPKEISLTLAPGDDGASYEIRDFGKKLARQIKAGFAVAPLKDPLATAKSLLALKDVGLEDALDAFTPEEREAIVAREIEKAEKAGTVVGGEGLTYSSADVFAKCPTRALLHHLLESMLSGKLAYKYDGGSLNSSLSFYATAISNAARDPGRAGWIAEEIQAAIEKAEPVLEKWLRARAGKFRSQKKVTAQLKTGPKPGEKTEDELLEAIGRAPDDDAPRLVWADWLLEHGVKWGEVVQRQCELEKMPPRDPRWQESYTATSKLQTSTIAKFLAPIRPFLVDYSIERGLIARLTVSVEKLLKPGAADAIVLRAPKARLALQGLKPAHVPALAKLPAGRFREVEIRGRLPADALEALLRSKLLDGLTEITLWGLDAKNAGALAALRAPLAEVCLWDCEAGGDAVAALAKSGAAKTITDLQFAGSGKLDEGGFAKLSGLPALSEKSRNGLRPKAA